MNQAEVFQQRTKQKPDKLRLVLIEAKEILSIVAASRKTIKNRTIKKSPIQKINR